MDDFDEEFGEIDLFGAAEDANIVGATSRSDTKALNKHAIQYYEFIRKRKTSSDVI